MQHHAVGHVVLARWGRQVSVYAAGDRYQRALLGISDARLVATVDQTVWGEEEQVDDPRILSIFSPEQCGEKLSEFGAYSAERGDGGKQGIEKMGTHDGGKMPRYLPLWQADICRTLLYRSARFKRMPR